MSNDEIFDQLSALGDSIKTTKGVMADLAKNLVCECCGGVDGVGIRPLMYAGPICSPCFYIWYDEGVTDSEKLREMSLSRQRLTVTVSEVPL